MARECLKSSMQRNANSLPAIVKLALSAPFIGKMNRVLVSRFVHPLDNYFKIIGLNDDVKMGKTTITLLEGTAYN